MTIGSFKLHAVFYFSVRSLNVFTLSSFLFSPMFDITVCLKWGAVGGKAVVGSGGRRPLLQESGVCEPGKMRMLCSWLSTKLPLSPHQ